MERGLVHLYYGMGKGKTTAAMGLCARMLGWSGRVLICQFLKTGDSGEVSALRTLGAKVVPGQELSGFLDRMPPEKREACVRQNRACFGEAVRALGAGYDLVVLDEIVDAAVRRDILTVEEVADAIRGRAPGTEVVLTGHSAPEALVELADYVTQMLPQKHPYTRGIAAREGIEY